MNIVQIGCHDGNDHVFDYIKNNSDKINKIFLIEPIEEKIQELKHTYNAFTNVAFFNLAITETDEKKETSFFIPLDLLHSQTSSVNKAHLSRHYGGEYKEIIIPCTTLNNFLTLHNLKTIDRLYIDAEGLDCKIVRSIDFDKFNIPYICYEHIHSDGACVFSDYGIETAAYLGSLGYRLHEHGMNTVAEK